MGSAGQLATGTQDAGVSHARRLNDRSFPAEQARRLRTNGVLVPRANLAIASATPEHEAELDLRSRCAMRSRVTAPFTPEAWRRLGPVVEPNSRKARTASDVLSPPPLIGMCPGGYSLRRNLARIAPPGVEDD